MGETSDISLNISKFSQNLKRSLNELRDKKIILAPEKNILEKEKNKVKSVSVSIKGKDTCKANVDIADKELEDISKVDESPTKKRKAESRLTSTLEKQELKRSLSFDSNKSTSDDEAHEITRENIDLISLAGNKESEEETLLELDCRDEFIKRCSLYNFAEARKIAHDDPESVANLIEGASLLKDQGVLINLNEISNAHLHKEEDEMFYLHRDSDNEKDQDNKQPEKEIGADLLLYLASSPSSSQKQTKPLKTNTSNNYSLNMSASQPLLLNKKNKSTKKIINGTDINSSAPSALLDYDGNTMLTSHASNAGANNNVSLQYSSGNNRFGNSTDNHNKYRLLSTPVTKNRDIFGQDSSILRYATMSGGSVLNSGLHTNYNDIPDVVLLNSRINLSDKINDMSVTEKSRVIDDDISLRGLEETSDEESESKNTFSSPKNNVYDSEDDKNKLFKTPNMMNSGVMPHMPSSMIDSVMLTSVSDAIHFTNKSSTSNGSNSSSN